MKKFLPAFLLSLIGLLAPAFLYADVAKDCFSTPCLVVQDAPWSNANQTWIVRPLNQGAPIAFQIVNKNPSNPHNFTLLYSVTYNPIVPDRTNNQMFWWTFTSGTCPGGNFTIGASTSLQCDIGNVTAAKFAIVVSGAGTVFGTPDTFDLYITQGQASQRTSINTISPVNLRGSLSAGPWSTTYTPSGILFPYTTQGDTGTGSVPAFTIMLANRGQTLVTPLKPVFSQFNTGGTSGNGWWGEAWGINTLPVAQMGVTYSATANQGAAGTITVNFNASGGVPTTNDWWASHETCTLFLNGTTTATSQNVYIQDSADNSNWCDHTSFAQITPVAPQKQLGTVGAIAGTTQVTTGVTINCVDAVMTAGTNLARKFQAYVRVKGVQIGAGSSTTSVLANCR